MLKEIAKGRFFFIHLREFHISIIFEIGTGKVLGLINGLRWARTIILSLQNFKKHGNHNNTQNYSIFFIQV